jgi:hypothetical protein|tara:strand:+ start:706 stop:873 length:168 start_codon:yes stop_codon:yes gene_type:complete
MPDMTPEDVEKYMDSVHPLPHIGYSKKNTKVTIQKEETNEEPERDSSGHPKADDA